MCARERFRNLKLVPTRRRPVAVQRHRDRKYRLTGFFREQHRAHFCDVTRTFRTVYRERRSTTRAHQSHHLDDRADTTARARPADRAVTKTLNEARDVFTVEAARRHHDDATFTPPVSR